MSAAWIPERGYGRVYQRWHSYDAAHVRQQCIYFKRMLGGLLPADAGSRILDLGCGMGFTMIALNEMGYHDIVGVDRDLDLVEGCLRQGLDVRYSSGGLDFLQANPAVFDVILMLDLLEHISPDSGPEFLNAVFHSLRPGGRIIVTSPNANASVAWRWRYICWTHETSFTETSLTGILAAAGFTVIEVREYELMSRPRWPLLPRPVSLRWGLLLAFRYLRRFELLAELGSEGRRLPLTPNLLATARHP